MTQQISWQKPRKMLLLHRKFKQQQQQQQNEKAINRKGEKCQRFDRSTKTGLHLGTQKNSTMNKQFEALAIMCNTVAYEFFTVFFKNR